MYEAPSSIIHHRPLSQLRISPVALTPQRVWSCSEEGILFIIEDLPAHWRWNSNQGCNNTNNGPCALQDLLLGHLTPWPMNVYLCIDICYVYSVFRKNMSSYYVNVFILQSHNNIDITCAVISYIYHVYYVALLLTTPSRHIFICSTSQELRTSLAVSNMAKSFLTTWPYKYRCMTSPPSFFWTQSDTIKFHDFGFRSSASCHSFAPTPRHPPIKKKDRQLWERQGQTAKSPKLNKKHVCNHGNLRVPPQCHHPQEIRPY